MHSTHRGHIDLPILPKEATVTHMFPSLASGSLLSIGQLCDAGCTALFTKTKLYIFFNGKIILQGTRGASRLWTIDDDNSTEQQQHSLNAAIDTPTIANRIKFYHASLYSPTMDTLKNAIDAGFLASFPGFTVKQLRKYTPSPESTAKGHMRMQPSNFRSTKTEHKTKYHLYSAITPAAQKVMMKPTLIPDDDERESTTQQQQSQQQTSPPLIQQSTPSPQQHPEKQEPIEETPQQEQHNQRTHFVYPSCLPLSGKIYTDQTGQFPVESKSGNKYLFVLYDYDSNYVAAQPIPSRTALQLKNAYQTIIRKLKLCGLTPKLQKLDNEASKLLQDYMEEEGIDFQLTPAGSHRRNAAEKAIQVFKNHFISGLSTTDPNFPLNLWDKLVPQAEITLNLLRPSRVNQNLSAYAQIHGQFNYSATPLAPPGIKVLTHILPSERKTWEPHTEPGFYIGPAMKHYRCHKVYITRTAAERIAQTVKWLPHEGIKMPIPTQSALIHAALVDLKAALTSRKLNNIVPPEDTTNHQALQELKSILDTLPQPTSQTREPNKIKPPQQPRVQQPSNDAPQPRVPPIKTKPSTTNTAQPRVLPSKSQPVNPQTPSTPAETASTHTRHPRRIRKPSKYYSPDFVNAAELSHYINAVLNKETGKLEEYRHLIEGKDKDIWFNGMSKELARLSDGRLKGDVKGMQAIEWQHPRHLPYGKTPTYMRVCADYRAQKKDPHRVRCTVGGNRIQYKGPTHTPTADLTLFKLFVNSILSTPNAKFIDMDISDFYLESTMDEPEYMMVPFKLFPPDIVQKYKLDEKVDDKGMVLAKIKKGMYGLPQAGRIAYDQLVPHLEKGGYIPAGITPGLFKHKTRPIQFILVVDDFGVKFTSEQDLYHLITHLKKKYRVTVGDGNLFCGVSIRWDYNKREAFLDMPKYIPKALQRFGYEPKKIPEHSPHACAEIRYSKKPQLAPEIEKVLKSLTPAELKFVQEVVGVFTFYTRAVDPTMNTAVGSISTSAKDNSFETLKKKINQLFDYAHTHPNAAIKFVASQMHLWVHTDASYLSETRARSRAGGYYFLSDKPQLPITPEQQAPTHNGAVHILCKIIDAVMTSAQEAELGAGYLNAKEIIPIRQALIEMGHPQGPTPLQFDNRTATDVINGDSQQRRSKHMDMRFHWLRDRERQKQFHFYWRPGTENKADYVTKHHPAKHHQEVRKYYVSNNVSLVVPLPSLQGCANRRYKTSKGSRKPTASSARIKQL